MRSHSCTALIVFMGCILAATHGVSADPAAAQPLADRVAKALRTALPQYEVVIADSLTLKINRDGKEKYQLNLDRISAYCAENKDDCDFAVQGFLDRSIKMLNTPELAVTAEKLRVVVRPKGFITQ